MAGKKHITYNGERVSRKEAREMAGDSIGGMFVDAPVDLSARYNVLTESVFKVKHPPRATLDSQFAYLQNATYKLARTIDELLLRDGDAFDEFEIDVLNALSRKAHSATGALRSARTADLQHHQSGMNKEV